LDRRPKSRILEAPVQVINDLLIVAIGGAVVCVDLAIVAGDDLAVVLVSFAVVVRNYLATMRFRFAIRVMYSSLQILLGLPLSAALICCWNALTLNRCGTEAS
jgi:hypothetical protein